MNTKSMEQERKLQTLLKNSIEVTGENELMWNGKFNTKIEPGEEKTGNGNGGVFCYTLGGKEYATHRSAQEFAESCGITIEKGKYVYLSGPTRLENSEKQSRFESIQEFLRNNSLFQLS